ncbi:MAG: hypothetical protein ACLR2E_17195 [Lachnospiraceae bacterium]
MSWSAKERSKFPSGANIRSPRAIFFTGKYTAHVKGFGFVEIEGQKKTFVSEEGSGGAFSRRHRIQVAVTPGRTGRRREGKIVRC